MKNTCNACGENNDGLLSTCIFCMSALTPKKSDSLSDEELIVEGGKWISRIIKDKMDNSVTINIKENGIVAEVSKSSVDANVSKYMDAIKQRSILNPELKYIYDSFKNDIKRNKESPVVTINDKNSDAKNVALGLVTLVTIIVMGVVVFKFVAFMFSLV